MEVLVSRSFENMNFRWLELQTQASIRKLLYEGSLRGSGGSYSYKR